MRLFKCPVCNVDLESITKRGIIYDVCPKCDGIWLGWTMFDRMKRNPDFKPKSELEVAMKRLEKRSIDCPECGARLHSAKIGETILDVCEECVGIWFDENEFEEVFQFNSKTGSYTLTEKIFRFFSRGGLGTK